MAFKQNDDYVPVAERMVEFREKYPNGSLQPLDLAHPYDFRMIDGKEAVIVVAAAYRTPDDPRPGIGMAYEPIPGPTQFTRGSELQNAETAAWGRAIMAALAADAKKGIATREDVENARARESAPAQQGPSPRPTSNAEIAEQEAAQRHARMMAQRQADIDALTAGINSLEQADHNTLLERWQANGLPKLKDLDKDQYAKATFLLRQLKGEIAQRTMALDPSLAPDYAEPGNEYMDGGEGA